MGEQTSLACVKDSPRLHGALNSLHGGSRRPLENQILYVLVQEVSGSVEYESSEPSSCVSLHCGLSVVRNNIDLF
jgi:hypothetical protein